MYNLLYKHLLCILKLFFLVFKCVQLFLFVRVYICLIRFSFFELQIYLILLSKKYNTMLLYMDLKYILHLYLLPTRVLHVCQIHLYVYHLVIVF
jgi:hypothetical protein